MTAAGFVAATTAFSNFARLDSSLSEHSGRYGGNSAQVSEPRQLFELPGDVPRHDNAAHASRTDSVRRHHGVSESRDENFAPAYRLEQLFKFVRRGLERAGKSFVLGIAEFRDVDGHIFALRLAYRRSALLVEHSHARNCCRAAFFLAALHSLEPARRRGQFPCLHRQIRFYQRHPAASRQIISRQYSPRGTEIIHGGLKWPLI
jgi:hypothetical protein